MFRSIRNLLRRSKETPVEEAQTPAKKSKAAKEVPVRQRPLAADDIVRLRNQHKELQLRFRQMQHGKSHLRRAKLLAALNRLASRHSITAAQVAPVPPQQPQQLEAAATVVPKLTGQWRPLVAANRLSTARKTKLFRLQSAKPAAPTAASSTEGIAQPAQQQQQQRPQLEAEQSLAEDLRMVARVDRMRRLRGLSQQHASVSEHHQLETEEPSLCPGQSFSLEQEAPAWDFSTDLGGGGEKQRLRTQNNSLAEWSRNRHAKRRTELPTTQEHPVEEKNPRSRSDGEYQEQTDDRPVSSWVLRPNGGLGRPRQQRQPWTNDF